ncbi:MAG: cellulase family glycosylhydrolase [Paracoccus sp. (in: a-proteobacteria)]
MAILAIRVLRLTMVFATMFSAGLAGAKDCARMDMMTDPMGKAPGAPGLAVAIASYRGRPLEDLRAEFAEYARLGILWLRTDLYWADVQADGRGRFDWSEFDRIVDLAAEQGIRVLPVAGTTPDWAAQDAEGPSTPADPADFAAFMTAAAKRYGPRGIHVWEIWNEPNLAGPWPPHPDPEAYAKLLIAAHGAIKAADPEALVLMGGLAAANWTGPPLDVQYVAASSFLDAVYDAGAGDAFDALAFHPYSYPDPPDPGWRWNGWGMMSGPLREIMARRGDGDKKIWITEFGAPTGAAGAISETEQAEFLREGARLAREADWAGPFLWYSYRDRGADPDIREDWFGIIGQDNRQKTAWNALRGAVNEFCMGSR